MREDQNSSGCWLHDGQVIAARRAAVPRNASIIGPLEDGSGQLRSILSTERTIITVIDDEECDTKPTAVASMDILTLKLRVVIRSKRWLVGNVLVAILNDALMRPRRPLAVDRIGKICNDYSAWNRAVFEDASPKQISATELRQLDHWIR